MTGLLDFEKLSEENYDTWQFRMKNALIYKGLWKQVDRKTDDSQDGQALSIIALSCSDQVVHHITECATAQEAWETLKNVFIRETPAAKVLLYKRLINLKCNSVSEVNTMIENFTQTVKKLAEVNIIIDDEILVIMLLSALPAQCEHFVIAMETRDDLPKLVDLKHKLKEEVQRQGDVVDGGEPDSKAMVIRSANNNNNNKVRKCFKCGRTGHIAKFCRSGNNKNNSSQNTSSAEVNKASKNAMYAAVYSAMERSDVWVLDSGATSHLCNNKSMLVNPVRHIEEVSIADDRVMKSEFKGTVTVRSKTTEIDLRDVLYVPGLKYNFLSGNVAVNTGHEIILRQHGAVIMKDNNVIATARKPNGLWLMNFMANNKTSSESEGPINQVHNVGPSKLGHLWHRRLGHVNYKSIVKMNGKNLVIGLDGINNNNNFSCVDCAKCKMTESPYPKEAQNRATTVLGRVHSDICGPMPKQSYGGARYLITFIDDYSRYVSVYNLKSKSEAFSAFVEYKELMERQTGNKLKILRTDNGKEYMNNEFNNYLKKNGIMRENSVPYSPPQNGVAERMNRTIIEMCRCMLTAGNMPEASWAEAVSTAAYIRNRVESSSVPTTPFELLYGKKPTLSHMRTYGCKAVVLLNGRHQRKFDQRGEVMRFVGYSTTQKGYRLINPQSGKLAISRSVRFFEDEMNNQSISIENEEQCEPQNHGSTQLKIELANEQDSEEEYSECKIDPLVLVEEGEKEAEEDKTDRLRRGPPRAAKANEINYIEPRSFRDAANGPSRSAW